MTNSVTTKSNITYDYKSAVEQILKELRRDRDRQIIARRFGFGLARRQTLEKIGSDFEITRERVRQIEKAAIAKMRTSDAAEIATGSELLRAITADQGGIVPTADVAEMLGAPETDVPYLVFLALLSPSVDLIEDNDDTRQAAGLAGIYSPSQVNQLLTEIAKTVKDHAKPITLAKLKIKLPSELDSRTLEQLMRISKRLAYFDGKWGLITWPEVNPKSIRDKTYLVLSRHGRPLHFSEIAKHVRGLGATKRNVTIQAVHNELIKDVRFILIGRGIYALAEWGYTPGTVAEIIASVLREEQPLHKDEIVRRVLLKRQVKTTTIILNLQEKDQFQRTAKATYKLND
ncbi:MAG TPA: sigma factor-like helix-turn-helix DNA-binding protein [Candidatus Saccharimonadia bacterium]|nr:sigma factor-like helix-turn-helix DNA-binding protein [Candidatus Saccharimonadia bacterium]